MKRAGFIPILDARYRAGGAEAWAMLQLLTTLYMAPPPPPPPLSVSKAPEPQRHAAVEKTSPTETPAVVESEPVPVEKPELTGPVSVPKDIAKIVDTALPSGASGARSGVMGGATTGLPGDLLGGVLGGTGNVPPPKPHSLPKERSTK